VKSSYALTSMKLNCLAYKVLVQSVLLFVIMIRYIVSNIIVYIDISRLVREADSLMVWKDVCLARQKHYLNIKGD
jgi:hypothetical protein